MKTSTRDTFALFLCVLLTSAAGPVTAAEASQVVDSSRTLPGGERVLEQSIMVPAPREKVWSAYTTSEGFASWAAPVAAVDFRLGGIIESSYDPEAALDAPENIENRIVAYVPNRMIAIKNVKAPPDTSFDAETFQRLHTVIFFEEVGPDETKVTVVQPGYRRGALYDGVYRHFEAGNRWSLEKLRERFEQGSTDWTSVLSRQENDTESR